MFLLILFGKIVKSTDQEFIHNNPDNPNIDYDFTEKDPFSFFEISTPTVTLDTNSDLAVHNDVLNLQVNEQYQKNRGVKKK